MNTRHFSSLAPLERVMESRLCQPICAFFKGEVKMYVVFNRALTFLKYGKYELPRLRGNILLSMSDSQALHASLNSEKHFHVLHINSYFKLLPPPLEAAVSSPFPPAEESSLLI